MRIIDHDFNALAIVLKTLDFNTGTFSSVDEKIFMDLIGIWTVSGVGGRLFEIMADVNPFAV